MKNPDKYIRKGFFDLLTSYGLHVYDLQIPMTVEEPPRYVLVHSQTKEEETFGKGCKIWDCTIVLDVFCVQDLSYVSSSEIDDYEEIIMNAVRREAIAVPYFRVHSLKMAGTPQSLPYTTDTQSILRKIIRYRLEVEETEETYQARLLENGQVRLLEN